MITHAVVGVCRGFVRGCTNNQRGGKVTHLHMIVGGLSCKGHRLNTNNGVKVTILKSSIAGNSFKAHFKSLRWGNQYDLQFIFLSQTGTYQAFGPTIGNAPGQALYSIAFRS